MEELLNKALLETKNLESGEIFLVRDLFKGYEWNRIERKDRVLLGIFFLNKVKSEKLDVSLIEKTSSKQQKYKKL
jgi:hypothetical protein